MFDFRMTPGSRLADVPSAWVQELPQGDEIVIFADGRGQLDDAYVYELMIDGQPISLLPVVRAPVALLPTAYTHLAQERQNGGYDWGSAQGALLLTRPDAWRVQLHSGHEVVAHANNHVEDERDHLFTLDVAGDGPALPVLRVSARLVSDVRREELPYMWLHEN